MKPYISILSALLICLLTSCGALYSNTGLTQNVDKKMKSIELGMTTDQVIELVGTEYVISAMSSDEAGNRYETRIYKDSYTEEYKLKFVNDKLKEWSMDKVVKYQIIEPVKATN